MQSNLSRQETSEGRQQSIYQTIFLIRLCKCASNLKTSFLKTQLLNMMLLPKNTGHQNALGHFFLDKSDEETKHIQSHSKCQGQISQYEWFWKHKLTPTERLKPFLIHARDWEAITSCNVIEYLTLIILDIIPAYNCKWPSISENLDAIIWQK